MVLARLRQSTDRAAGDSAVLLRVYVVLLLVVPSALVVAPLGAAGTPAQLFGMGLAVLAVVWSALGLPRPSPEVRQVTRTPVMILMAGFVTCVLLSYSVAATRPLSSVELSSADRSLLTVISWTGVLVTGLAVGASAAAEESVLRRVATLAGLMALLGIVQFLTGDVIVDRISIPGLTVNGDIGGVGERVGFTRIAATAVHPLEFGVVLSMALPLALHVAMDASSPVSRPRRWWPVVAIAVAVPLSISRSAIICVVVALVIVATGWSGRQRRNALGWIVVLLMSIYVLIPGMLGTLLKLFTGLSDDGSVLSRTDSYSLAGEFIAQSPVVGRGLFTFLPQYRILDNQYLGLLIEIGVLGTLAFLALLVGSVVTGLRGLGDRAPRDRSRTRALVAAVAAAGVSMATFDALGFPMVPGLLFVCIGLLGARRPVPDR